MHWLRACKCATTAVFGRESMWGIARRSLLAVAVAFLSLQPAPPSAEPGGSGAVAQPAGLMWNRTGLPAVFPLQVKSSPGQNYYLTLLEAETGTPALAAFIEGGRFFKVLVPPGTYDLRLIRGETWHGEEQLFGPGERSKAIPIDGPLTFAIRDFSTKAGHLVNVSAIGPDNMDQVVVKPQFICQTVRLKSFPRLRPAFNDRRAYDLRFPERDDLVRLPRFAKESLRATGKAPVFPDRRAPLFSLPEYEVRSSLC